MKKVINWFKKRTVNKIIIVMFAVCTICLLIVGEWWNALIEFAFFVAWVVIDLNDNTIEVQGNTIKMLVGDLTEKRKDVLDSALYLSFWMHKYMFAKAKLDFINGRISGDEFGKQYNYYSDKIEQDIKLIDGRENRKEAQDENDSNR
jgi:hypothetical protein